ncbi:MAG: aminoacyl-tRNA hydrolase [bacterium]
MSDKKEWLVAGLGNPGKQYERTKHNVGFWAIDIIAKRLNISCDIVQFHSCWGKGTIKNQHIKVIKPQTFMNLSGQGIIAFMSHWRIDPERLIVIHDDMDIAAGSVRICQNRGPGGHKGVESIISSLGTHDFIRIRIGIGHPQKKDDPKEYVLSFFEDSEKQRLDYIIQKSYEMIFTIIVNGLQIAMNRYNNLCFHEPDS